VKNPSGSVDEIEGPEWRINAGEVTRGHQSAWRSDGVESLTYNNPFDQVMERVWFDGKDDLRSTWDESRSAVRE
jgi:hypothetical protein